MKNRNIPLYNAVYESDNLIKITIDFCDRRKFFAICKNMCYNIKKVNYSGLLSPVLYFIKNIGFVIGIALFTILAYIFNDFIFAIDYTGSGSIISNEISKTISDNGASVFSRFSKINLSSLENEVLLTNKNLSFVSIKKQGNRLIINSNLSSEEPLVQDKNTIGLYSNINGVVERVNVLRGTPLVRVGDFVKNGDILIGAYITDKNGEKYDTYIVGSVYVIEEKTVFIKSSNVDDETLQKILKIAEFNETLEVVEKYGEVVEGGVNVKMKIRHVLVGG